MLNFLRCNSRLNTLRINPPNSPLSEIRQPHRPQPHPKSIPTFPKKLLDHLIRRRVNARNGKLERSNPDTTQPDGDITPRPRNTHFNGSNHLVGLHIDLRNTSIRLIQCPDKTIAHSEEASLLAN